jgi:serine/threonine protein kinase
MNNLDYRKNKNDKYNITDIDKCKTLIANNKINDVLLKSIGEGKSGVVYIVKNNCGVIKIYKDRIHKNKNFLDKIKKEIQMSQIIRDIIKKNICPNFIYSYLEKYNESQSYIVMEQATNDLRHLFNVIEKHRQNKKIDYDQQSEIYKSIFFQIIVGILCMHKIIGINHNDLSLTNIVYKKINKNIILKYIINDKTFYVRTYGYLIMIIDFEYMVKIKNNKNYDFRQLSNIYYRPIKVCLTKQNIDTWEKLLKIIDINDIQKKNKIINYIDEKIKKENTDDPSRQFSLILYYLINNNLIDYKSMCDKKTINLSEQIKKFNVIFFDSSKDIFEIIKDNFKDYETKLDYHKEFIMRF